MLSVNVDASGPENSERRIPFRRRVAEIDPTALAAERTATLLVNIGLRCDLECAHCHLRCSPERDELMSVETMDAVVAFAESLRPDLVDVTGGAPELHPRILPFLRQLRDASLSVRLRSNLTALGGPARELVEPLAWLSIGILASVPFDEGDAPGRDPSLWNTCLETLQLLAQRGYGSTDGPVLDLAVNAAGPLCATDSASLELRLRERLEADGVRFRDLLLITDMPLGRFADGAGSDGLRAYTDGLMDLFESTTLSRLGCRHGIEVAWDGTLWDCDFNLGAGLRPPEGFRTLDEVDVGDIEGRPISFGPHCYACTAGAGSS
jgi:radical SAM/Cys-rich protein